MTWVVWRQHRAEGLIALGVLAVLGVFLLITGLDMANSFQQLGLSNCLGQVSEGSTCSGLRQAFENQYSFLLSMSTFLIALPLLVGALVGAPLVAREVEQHTHLLIWTQSVTRARWLTVKLALVLVAGLLAAGVMLALLIWWRSPSTQFMGSFSNSAFDTSGPVWVGAMLLALALGVFAGTLTRRVVFAIFLTIALFVAIRAPVELLLRPNFEPPITVTWPLGTASKPITLSGQDWLIATGYIDAQGNKTNRFACSADKSLDQCAQADGLTGHYLTYQPADRFWAFQWIETGIYLAFSALALSATVWLVRRRLS
jgi:hypothetical protein